ncbi:hypothetical protein [uncultured Enterovirga sp.]|uniref:hypothetical protein n=1 Tax=uncultured Enterovirga sp. TaxID=2026352 RepID=UPI0035CC00A5
MTVRSLLAVLILLLNGPVLALSPPAEIVCDLVDHHRFVTPGSSPRGQVTFFRFDLRRRTARMKYGAGLFGEHAVKMIATSDVFTFTFEQDFATTFIRVQRDARLGRLPANKSVRMLSTGVETEMSAGTCAVSEGRA